MDITHVLLPIDLANDILAYLQQRPYVEVYRAIDRMRSETTATTDVEAAAILAARQSENPSAPAPAPSPVPEPVAAEDPHPELAE